MFQINWQRPELGTNFKNRLLIGFTACKIVQNNELFRQSLLLITFQQCVNI